MCCDSWGRKELDTTEQLNRNDSYKMDAHRPKSLALSAKLENDNGEKKLIDLRLKLKLPKRHD